MFCNNLMMHVITHFDQEHCICFFYAQPFPTFKVKIKYKKTKLILFYPKISITSILILNECFILQPLHCHFYHHCCSYHLHRYCYCHRHHYYCTHHDHYYHYYCHVHRNNPYIIVIITINIIIVPPLSLLSLVLLLTLSCHRHCLQCQS